MLMLRYALALFNETHGAGLKKPVWHSLCVDLPPEYGSVESYRVTLGHKEDWPLLARVCDVAKASSLLS